VEYYVGIDVSLELSSVCVVKGRGKLVKEAKIASEPAALVCFFKELGVPVNRIGLEAGPLSQWLHAGLSQAGFQTVLLETRHVKAGHDQRLGISNPRSNGAGVHERSVAISC
jgi:transposase